jgi:hypothetical protein
MVQVIDDSIVEPVVGVLRGAIDVGDDGTPEQRAVLRAVITGCTGREGGRLRLRTGSRCTGDFTTADHLALVEVPIDEVKAQFGIPPLGPGDRQRQLPS